MNGFVEETKAIDMALCTSPPQDKSKHNLQEALILSKWVNPSIHLPSVKNKV